MAFDCVDAARGSIAMAGVSELRQAGEFAPAAILTLLEDREMDGVHLPQGPDLHRLPIRDGGVPDRAFEILWTYSGLGLRSQLRAGARILIHCRGGMGRTGTLAARLLVELGVTPAAAIAAVRRARPGALENAEQEKHVHRCHPAHNDALLERRLACLLGGAVGDGFGCAVEFDRLPSIRSRYGPRGLREPVLRDGLLPVSDDTQMTLFTLEGLARAIGLHAALAGRDFSDALAIAANHDGDSDSTASIAGQLYGAWRGLGGIPHAWITAVDVLEPLLALVWKAFGSRSSTASRSS